MMDPLGSDRITEVPEFQVPLTPAATVARKAAQWIWPRMDVVPWLEESVHQKLRPGPNPNGPLRP